MSTPAVSAKRIYISYVLLGALAIAALLGLFLWVIREDTRRNEERVVARYVICAEVEKLKAGEREDAIRTYRERHRTLRLLRLRSTPELQRLFRRNRDRDLALYAKDDCVKVARDPLGLEIDVPKR